MVVTSWPARERWKANVLPMAPGPTIAIFMRPQSALRPNAAQRTSLQSGFALAQTPLMSY